MGIIAVALVVGAYFIGQSSNNQAPSAIPTTTIPSSAAQGEINNLQRQASQKEITTLQTENQQAQATEKQQQAEIVKEQELGQLFSIGNTLQDYYNKIRDAQNLGSSSCPDASQCEVNFWAFLADDVNSGTNYETTYNALTGQQNSGSFSYAAVAAEKQLNNLVFASYAAAVAPSDSDAIKIKKILDFIDTNITYERDMRETPRAPAETLGLKSGDCKSYSILTSAALATAGIRSAVIRAEKTDATQSHAMVLVQSDENLQLSEYYSDLTQFGLPAGRWWVIEPQYTFEEQQQHSDWFAQWKLIHAAQVAISV